jgi:hypothetical protein
MSHPVHTLLRASCLFGFVAATAVLAGCGKPTGSVSGKVTFKDAPLKAGTIGFHSTDNSGSVGGTINSDGTYSIASIPAGDYKIVIETDSFKPPSTAGRSYGKNNPKDEKVGKEASKGKETKELDAEIKEKLPAGYHMSNPGDANAAARSARYIEIPHKYGKADTTDLTYTVVAGSQTKNFDLK